MEAKPVARAIAAPPLLPDAQGWVHVLEAPGLGVTVGVEAMRPYLVQAELRVGGEVLWRTLTL